jgi:hypothetical protein
VLHGGACLRDFMTEKARDGGIRGEEMQASPDVESVLVQHSTDLLRRIRHALTGGGEHGVSHLLVGEAGEHGDDNEDKRGDQERQLPAERQLRERRRHVGRLVQRGG